MHQLMKFENPHIAVDKKNSVFKASTTRNWFEPKTLGIATLQNSTISDETRIFFMIEAVKTTVY